jgi:hypothetical protein
MTCFASPFRYIIWNICTLYWYMQYVVNRAGQNMCQGNYWRLDNVSDSAHEVERSYLYYVTGSDIL